MIVVEECQPLGGGSGLAKMAERELAEFEITSNDILGLKEGKSKGSGSYGAVYAITVRGVPRIAKRLHSILVSAEVSLPERRGIRERSLDEYLLLSKLDHPNVVKFIGVNFNPRARSDVTLLRPYQFEVLFHEYGDSILCQNNL